jgi:F0F1-type ATP synthase membrane subunit b/b'
MSFSVSVFLFVLMFSFGFITQNVRRFQFWRFILLSILIIAFLINFGISKQHLMVMFVSFFVGYLLPYAYVLRGVGEALSDFINAIRYRDAYEEIKRKEEEVEELRKQYEEAYSDAKHRRKNWEDASKKRQQESAGFRQEQEQAEKKQRSSSNSNNSYNYKQKSYDQSGMERASYLITLGLDPNEKHSFADIKKAYRRKAMQFHPDRHGGKSQSFQKEMEEKFKQVRAAFEELAKDF